MPCLITITTCMTREGEATITLGIHQAARIHKIVVIKQYSRGARMITNVPRLSRCIKMVVIKLGSS